MATEAENLGLQQVPVTEVRSGGQIAGSVAASAASGAQAGSVLAPWGTVVGAVVGGGIAVAGQIMGKKAEKARKASDEEYNSYVDRMSKRYGGTTVEQAMVAENGLQKSDEDYNMVEFEKYEMHVRPKYDFKGRLKDIDVIQVAPNVTHEEANGQDPSVLIPTEKGKSDPDMPAEVSVKEPIRKNDAILNTQDPKRYAKMNSLIQRFKVGDDKAGEELQDEINKLPEDKSLEENPDTVDVVSEEKNNELNKQDS
jgi:hypothetical protein